jgi:hypothetical protein
MAQQDVGTMAQEDAGGIALRSSTKLGPTQDNKVLMQRFQDMREFAATKKRKKDFHPDTFAKLAKAHVEKYSIAKFGDEALRRHRGGPQTVVIKEVATFKDVHFYMNPRKTTDYYSVINEEMREVMHKRGYKEIHPVHITNVANLPPNVAAALATNSAWDEQPAIGVPEGNHYPSLFREGEKGQKETMAASIVRAVEEKLVDEDRESVWSPYRLWTLQDRKSADSKLTKYLAAYYFIRSMNKGTRPEDITETLAVMTSSAVAVTLDKTNKWYQMRNKWYHATLEVYEEVLSAGVPMT